MDCRIPETDQKRKSREMEELVSGLTREQRKQWESFGTHEKARILKRVEDRVRRRMRFWREPARPPEIQNPGRTEVTCPGTKNPDHRNSERTEPAGAPRKRESFEKTVKEKGSRAGARQKSLSSDCAIKISHPPVIKGSDVHVFDWFPDQRVQAGKHLRNSAKRAKRNFARQAGVMTREAPETAQRKDEKKDQAVPSGKEGFVNVQNRIRQKNPGIRKLSTCSTLEETWHVDEAIPDPIRQRSFKRMQRSDSKDVRNKNKRESVKKRLMKSEFVSLLSKDEKRRENIRQMQRLDEISLSGMEHAVGADALHTASFPVRAKLSQIREKATAQFQKAAVSLLKYAAGFGGILFLVVFLFFFITAFAAAIAGQAQEGSAPLYCASGEEIVSYAEEWIGVTKYVYGAGRSSPTDWQDYADCSSFVHGVYQHFGIELGGDTRAMENSGTLVQGGLASAMPGDIILFYSGQITAGNSSHVGIYAGEGMMVHCSGNQNNRTAETAGRGVCMEPVAGDGRPYEVRRVITDAYAGNRTDPSDYTRSQLETIWAVICQEDGRSYAGALAVISTAMNRTESPQWSFLGKSAYEQLTAPGQFCYGTDIWKKYLNGNVPSYVKEAVSDCLARGIRNHTCTSFRSYYTPGSVQIGGGNYYFS